VTGQPAAHSPEPPRALPGAGRKGLARGNRAEGGPLFRAVNRHGQVSEAGLSDRAVALVVKRRAEAAGLDPGISPATP
jgi:hypothetical protein